MSLFVLDVGDFNDATAFRDQILLPTPQFAENPISMTGTADGETVYLTARYHGVLWAVDVRPQQLGTIERIPLARSLYGSRRFSSRFPCTLGELAASASVAIDVHFSVPVDYSGPETVQNTATVSTPYSIDPDSSNATAVASTLILPGYPIWAWPRTLNRFGTRPDVPGCLWPLAWPLVVPGLASGGAWPGLWRCWLASPLAVPPASRPLWRRASPRLAASPPQASPRDAVGWRPPYWTAGGGRVRLESGPGRRDRLRIWPLR